MLRGAGQKQPSSGYAHAGSADRGAYDAIGRRTPPRHNAVLERRTGAARVLGFCCWVLAGGAAFFAIWELGNFSVLVGNAPLFPAVVREAPPADLYRPAGGGAVDEGGCTQAPIDRSSGQTTPADCHTSAPGRDTMMALLSTRRLLLY